MKHNMKMKLYDVTFADGTCTSVVAYDYASAEHVARIHNRKSPITIITVQMNVLVYR